MVRTSPSTAIKDFDLRHPLRPIVRAGALSLGLFLLSAVFASEAFQATTPAPVRMGLEIYVALYLALWMLGILVMVVRRPRAEEAAILWDPIAKAVIYGAHIACLWLIWAVLPYGSTDAQLMAVVFLTAYAPAQIISSPENAVANRVGIVLILGSTAIFLLGRGTSIGTMLGVYIAFYGVIMFVLSDSVRSTVKFTLEARQASERTARELERLLAVVTSERDAKTRFISAASHDLGQPLQAAALFFDQTRRATDEASRARAVDGVLRAFASAEQLLAHMLNHLRLEADSVEPHPSLIAVPTFLERMAALHQPLAQSAGMRIHLRSRDLALMLDPVLLERAIGNLLHNAVQHSAGSRILLAARTQGQQMRIWVIDDGEGVGRSDAKHIFDDFFQGAVARGGIRTGFGLGLASVKRIAELMGGVAGLEPRWLRGAAFYLEFPLARSAAVRINRQRALRSVGRSP